MTTQNLLNEIVGTYTVVYPQGDINQELNGYSPSYIKDQLATRYSELTAATLVVTPTTVNGVTKNVITFSLPSGQKN